MKQLLFATYFQYKPIINREALTMSDDTSQIIALERPATGLPATTNPSRPSTINSGKNQPEPMVLKLLRLAFRLGGRLSPTATGRMAYKLWFTPTRFKTPAREQKVLEFAEIEFLQINNHSIATYSWGPNNRAIPTVLLVHGWSGRGSQLGSFVQPLLDAGYRVLSFDAPAHGKSSGKQTNLYDVADTLLALQDHYGAFDAVITHSFGGPCIATAVQRGFTTKRIASICPPATTIGLVEKFNSTLHIPEKAASNMIRHIETTFGKTIWEDISMINTAKALTMPGLLIHDSNDADIPWQEGQAVAQAWNNASFVKTSGLGHRRILRDAGVIETTVRFINDKQ